MKKINVHLKTDYKEMKIHKNKLDYDFFEKANLLATINLPLKKKIEFIKKYRHS